MPSTNSSAQRFAWETQPVAARWVQRAIDNLTSRQPALDGLRRVLRDQTGTRLVDWIDHFWLASEETAALGSELGDGGYVAKTTPDHTIWTHPLGMFPAVLTGGQGDGVGLRVESIDSARSALPPAIGIASQQVGPVSGERGGPFRRAKLDEQHGVGLWIVERHGHPGFVDARVGATEIEAAPRHLAAFRQRQRRWAAIDEGFEHALALFEAAEAQLGTDWACDLFFQAEREYWRLRNRAAGVQYKRQNRLGLGWANHDHHTYRSSRAAFSRLIAALERMGFLCRERFYAGREAGWGAQVLEQPRCRVVIFADVDLTPDEVADDFAHQPFGECERQLGTVGLWCDLHGEAFLEAGMHHLECQFDFNAARTQLAEVGIETMAPFTDFPYLKQAFTKGEVWTVDARRIELLLTEGRITADQAIRFGREGAIGSHLEILERNDGYKGFNQSGISEIITRTDPRRVIGA